MSNLIPDISVHGPWPRLRARMLFAIATGIASTAAVTAAVLVPTLMVYDVGTLSPSVESSTSNPDADTVQAIAGAQALLTQLSLLAPTSSPASIAAEIVGKRPKDVTITHITYARSVPGVIVVSGKTTRRDAVNEYRSILATNPLFTSVSVPINALVGTQDGTFSLTVNGQF